MILKTASSALRVSIVTLGCPKNLVDTEVLAGQLLSNGVWIISDPAEADAVIVNTCAFIDAAKAESVDTILHLADVRDRTRPFQALIVAGCLPQRFRESLSNALPEVDAFIGIDQIPEVSALVRIAVAQRREKLQYARSKLRAGLQGKKVKPGKVPAATNASRPATSNIDAKGQGQALPLVFVSRRPTYILNHTTPRLRFTPRHYAYVKIADGCNHPCSFCTIPIIRGPYRSRPLADIIAEAKTLLADGCKELNLISQDSTLYGRDLQVTRAEKHFRHPQSYPRLTQDTSSTDICTLLRALDSLSGEFWIRLLYTHPANWTDELIRTIAECKKVVKYVDIPLQHINDTILQQMHRRISRQQIVELISRLRYSIPGVVLRTSFIVGFPGETKEQFDELLGFVRAMRFDRVGVFTYSREEGTRAAGLPGQVPTATKRARAAQLMKLQQQIARELAETYVGRIIKVLVESRAEDKLPREHSDWEHAPAFVARPRNMKLSPNNFFIARSEADAPEIDGVVYVHARKKPLQIGQFLWVKVIGHTDYDLIAEPVLA